MLWLRGTLFAAALCCFAASGWMFFYPPTLVVPATLDAGTLVVGQETVVPLVVRNTSFGPIRIVGGGFG